MIVCTRCGSENTQGQKYCSNCNAVLPNIPQAGQMVKDPDKEMGRYNQLREAVEKIKSGEWSIDEYADFIENIAEALAQKETEIRDIEIPEEAYDDFAEELEVGFNGIALYNEGVSHMMLYLEDENVEHLDYGLELAYQGNEQINEAMCINRRNRRKLEEMYIDTSTVI